MSVTINLETVLSLRDKGAVLVDARSPAEFEEATIPGAINIPVLDNDERKQIGTLYKLYGKEKARRRGVELVASKIPFMVEQAASIQAGTALPVIVFCWRGGLRSLALTQFLELAGVPARQLSFGHKGFRRHVLNFFNQAPWGRLIVLRGLTGVGKTGYLKRLLERGHPIIDLENLANHRGSAFGHLGMPHQPTQKMFEALIWDQLRSIPENGYAILEGESRFIGRLAIPLPLYRSMQEETSIWIQTSLSKRVQNILADYPTRDSLKTDFAEPIKSLKDKLGTSVVESYLEMLESGCWKELITLLMENYYDPLYQHTLPKCRVEVDLECDNDPMDSLERAIATVLNNSKGDNSFAPRADSC